MEPSSGDLTLLLKRYGNGDADALAELIPQVYDELHRLASCYLHGERVDTRYRPLPWSTKSTFAW